MSDVLYVLLLYYFNTCILYCPTLLCMSALGRPPSEGGPAVKNCSTLRPSVRASVYVGCRPFLERSPPGAPSNRGSSVQSKFGPPSRTFRCALRLAGHPATQPRPSAASEAIDRLAGEPPAVPRWAGSALASALVDGPATPSRIFGVGAAPPSEPVPSRIAPRGPLSAAR